MRTRDTCTCSCVFFFFVLLYYLSVDRTSVHSLFCLFYEGVPMESYHAIGLEKHPRQISPREGRTWDKDPENEKAQYPEMKDYVII